MDCVQLRLKPESTTIVFRNGWLIIESTDPENLDRELERGTANRLFSVSEISKKTGFSPNAVRTWLKTGKLTGTRLGKEYRVHERDLAKFLKGAPEPKAEGKIRIGRRKQATF
jgi:excisionase family DNA binding protein